MKPQKLTYRLVSAFLCVLLIVACNASSSRSTDTPVPAPPTATSVLLGKHDLLGKWQFVDADKAPLQSFVFFEDGIFIVFLKLIGTDTWQSGQYQIQSNQIRLDYRDKTVEIFNVSISSKQLKLNNKDQGELVLQYIGPPSDLDRPSE